MTSTPLQKKFAKKYSVDVSYKSCHKAIHLRYVYDVSFETRLTPYNLSNAVNTRKLRRLFPNICIDLRIYCTLFVSISSSKQSYSALARITKFNQGRISGLATLNLETELAKKLDFQTFIP